MAGLKNINQVLDVGNPVRMDDLQNLWQAINSIAGQVNSISGTFADNKIISGFDISSTNYVGSGIILHEGIPYYYPGGNAMGGLYLYKQIVDEDERLYEGADTHNFYSNQIINTSSTTTATGIGTYIGELSSENIFFWKNPNPIPFSVNISVSTGMDDVVFCTNKLSNIFQYQTPATVNTGTITGLQYLTVTIPNSSLNGNITLIPLLANTRGNNSGFTWAEVDNDATNTIINVYNYATRQSPIRTRASFSLFGYYTNNPGVMP